jgi:hypothetical protein
MKKKSINILGKKDNTLPTPFTTPFVIKSYNKPCGKTVPKNWLRRSKSHKIPSCGYFPNVNVQKNINQMKKRKMIVSESFLIKGELFCKIYFLII